MKTYHDLEGDGGSDVVGQLTSLQEQTRQRLNQVHHKIAIASGKGGVGKSTFTALLAHALHRNGARVAVLDADLNGPAQARLLGMQNIPLLPGDDGVPLPRTSEGIGVVSVGAMVPEPLALSFDSIAVGDSHVWRATREFALLGQLLVTIEWGALDYLLIDLPPGAERTLQHAEFLGESVEFILLTIPSELSKGVVTRAVTTLRQTPNPVLGYVENMHGYYCEACQEIKPLFPNGRSVDLELPCLARIPFDPEVARRADAGKLGEGLDRPSLTAIDQLANDLIEKAEHQA